MIDKCDHFSRRVFNGNIGSNTNATIYFRMDYTNTRILNRQFIKHGLYMISRTSIIYKAPLPIGIDL